MLIDWLSKKELKDSDSLIISGAAVIIFAVSVLIIDAILLWNLNSLLLVGMAVIAGAIGFFVAKTSPIMIKVIPPVVFVCVTAVLSNELYHSYTFEKDRTEFLEKTDNCHALGLQIVNKASGTPVCMQRHTLANNKYCSYFRDNEWFCKTFNHADVIAKPKGHILHQVVMVE